MNVGSAKGCPPYLKKLLWRPMEWNVYLFYGNELLFCALFALYDGPLSFQRPLRKELQGDLTMRKPVQCAKVKNDSFPKVPDKVVAELSHDQEYMYDMCR